MLNKYLRSELINRRVWPHPLEEKSRVHCKEILAIGRENEEDTPLEHHLSDKKAEITICRLWEFPSQYCIGSREQVIAQTFTK